MNLVEGVAREVGREGGRDGRVSHAIGKGNERALHVHCCTLLCAGGMDGGGGRYLHGWFRAEASGERARSVRE